MNKLHLNLKWEHYKGQEIKIKTRKFNYLMKLYNRTKTNNLKQRNIQLKHVARVKH